MNLSLVDEEESDYYDSDSDSDYKRSRNEEMPWKEDTAKRKPSSSKKKRWQLFLRGRANEQLRVQVYKIIWQHAADGFIETETQPPRVEF